MVGFGNGLFQPAVHYPVGSDPGAVEIGDFNGDTRPDLAIANFFDNNVSVLLNQTTVSPTPTPTTTPTSGPTSTPTSTATATPTATPGSSTRIKDITFEGGSLINATSGVDSTSGTINLETAAPIMRGQLLKQASKR